MHRTSFIRTNPLRVAESVERDYKEKLSQGRTSNPGELCGRHLRRRTLSNGCEVIQNLRKWKCEPCRAEMIRVLLERASIATLKFGLTRFATLTIDQKKIPEGKAPPEYLMECWSRFSKVLRRKMPEVSWLWVIDVGKNDWHFHLHILFSEYINWKSLRGMWQRAGGGEVTDIRKIDERHNFTPLYIFNSFGTQRDPVFVAESNGWKVKRRYYYSEPLRAIMKGEECEEVPPKNCSTVEPAWTSHNSIILPIVYLLIIVSIFCSQTLSFRPIPYQIYYPLTLARICALTQIFGFL